ncbi:MAG TPA: ABC transporter substrate-binding protein [Chloroflexota bacterium]|nr:ABC transporter substrate-binding protein [Chloroflexota bacterium]
MKTRFRMGPLLAAFTLAVMACAPAAPAPPPSTPAPTAPAKPAAEPPKPAEAAKPAEQAKPTAQPAAADQPQKGGTITRPILYGDPASLDPILQTRVAARLVTMNIFSQLIKYDYDKKTYVGDLAEKWEVSPDGLTYTFSLRKGVKFHNGRELKAADVRYSFERVLDKKWSAADFSNLFKIKGAEDFREGRASEVSGLKVLDEYTFVMETREADAIFFGTLSSVSYSAVPREEVEKYGLEFGVKGPVGSGPFKFESYTKDDQITLTRFDDYYKGPAYLDKLVFRTMSEAGTRQNEFLAGNLDFMVLTDAQYRQFREDAKWKNQLVEVPELFTRILIMNVTKKPFDDVRVRQAMNYAINREETIENVLFGKAYVPTGPMQSSMPGYDPNLKGYTYEPAKAKDLLAAAGYPNGFEVEFVAGTHPVVGPKAADTLKPYFDPLGIKLSVKAVEGAALTQVLQDGDFVLAGTSTGGTVDPLEFVWARFYSKNAGLAGNYARYSNPKIDELLDKARATLNESERLKLVAEVNRIATEEAPWLLWHYNKAVQIVQPWVRGVKPIPTDIDYQDMHQMWIDKAQKR